MSESWSTIPTNNLSGPDPLVGTPSNPTINQLVQKLQTMTAEEPVEYVLPKWYVCTMPNASMFRKDGTRIIFLGGVLETNLRATQQYLDTEIGTGNTFLRIATDAEIQEAKMRRDPRGTMKEAVRAEIEAELRTKLEAEIMERLGMLSGSYIPGQDQVDSSNRGASGIAGSDVADNLAATKQVLRTNNATLIMESTPAPLKGIVSSADVSEGAAGSASSSGFGVPNQ
jgi:hypothetical protein